MEKIAGKIVTHEREWEGTIEFDSNTGLITKVKDGIDPEARQFPEGTVIFPGFGDIHIHAREDVSGKHTYKEDFISAGNAAINGGVIHVADMPNNPVPPIDDESYTAKQALTKKAPIHITLYAGIGPHTKPLTKKFPIKCLWDHPLANCFFMTMLH